MWILGMRIRAKDCIWSPRCKRLGIYDYQYELTNYRKGQKYRVVSAHILSGALERQEAYVRACKKDKRVVKIERMRNSFMAVADEPMHRRPDVWANPQLIFLKPIINRPDGYEDWEVGSYEKKVLVERWELARKRENGQLLYLKRGKMPGVFIAPVAAPLTEAQKEALRLAIDNDYYEVPKKTTIQKLAKVAGVSNAAYDERLRRAEKNLMEFMKEMRL